MICPALLKLVALAKEIAVTPYTLATTVAPWVPVTSPARLPLKLVALPAEVAVAALPEMLMLAVPGRMFAAGMDPTVIPVR